MDNTNAALPSGAWVAWILVLIYSAICLAATILLSSMLIVNGERFNCTDSDKHCVGSRLIQHQLRSKYIMHVIGEMLESPLWRKPKQASTHPLSDTVPSPPASIWQCSRCSSLVI
ncbi:hypothetical protein KC337_g34 [Hortaea werneckii]|nr:hypothetical protein KC337_g34 [Hortaea werneckii]